jgi:hypothetical protein
VASGDQVAEHGVQPVGASKLIGQLHPASLIALTRRRADPRTPQAMILPLPLAQFIASYAATNTNAAIGSIAKDLGKVSMR